MNTVLLKVTFDEGYELTLNQFTIGHWSPSEALVVDGSWKFVRVFDDMDQVITYLKILSEEHPLYKIEIALDVNSHDAKVITASLKWTCYFGRFEGETRMDSELIAIYEVGLSTLVVDSSHSIEFLEWLNSLDF